MQTVHHGPAVPATGNDSLSPLLTAAMLTQFAEPPRRATAAVSTRNLTPTSVIRLIAIVIVTIVLLILFPSFRDATAWQDEYQMPLIGP
jgi:hypothetical protein